MTDTISCSFQYVIINDISTNVFIFFHIYCFVHFMNETPIDNCEKNLTTYRNRRSCISEQLRKLLMNYITKKICIENRWHNSCTYCLVFSPMGYYSRIYVRHSITIHEANINYYTGIDVNSEFKYERVILRNMKNHNTCKCSLFVKISRQHITLTLFICILYHWSVRWCQHPSFCFIVWESTTTTETRWFLVLYLNAHIISRPNFRFCYVQINDW